ncbi:MAG TPA: transglycosylase family protein [Gaiellaceae bacterium]
MRHLLPLSLLGLAALITVVLAGAAHAQQNVRPLAPGDVKTMRSVADHYRTITWTFERAALEHTTPTSYSYRHTTNRSYLQWTIDTWTRRAYRARNQALARVERKLAVALPKAPALHSRLAKRIAYSRRVALRLRRIYPGTVTKRFAEAQARTAAATLRLWQKRLAAQTLLVIRHGRPHPAQPALPSFLVGAFTCIHHYEGSWSANTGNGYYGGLQMDLGFQSTYGGEFLRRFGTADRWPVWAQLTAAVRAYRSGRGFSPWPATARACGLL